MSNLLGLQIFVQSLREDMNVELQVLWLAVQQEVQFTEVEMDYVEIVKI